MERKRFHQLFRNATIRIEKFVDANRWKVKRFSFSNEKFDLSKTKNSNRFLLQHQWSKAIDAILAFDETIKHDWLRHLLAEWNEKRDLKTILDGHLTYRRSIEVDLLRGLQKSGENNPIGALSSVPRNSRLLYLHAYQSMIWNRIVSKRIRAHSTEVLIGDLYLKNIHADDDDHKQIDYVTEDNRSNIQLEQIVLPLPGYDIKYPLNEIHQWYKEMLNDDGIDIDQMKYHVKDYSLPGQYRTFVVRPGQVESNFVSYDQITDDPLQSDYDRLMNRQISESIPFYLFHRFNLNNENFSWCLLSALTNSAQIFSGLVLAFSLPKSSYATMALRELLHRNESQLQTNHDDQIAKNVNDDDNGNDEIEDIVV